MATHDSPRVDDDAGGPDDSYFSTVPSGGTKALVGHIKTVPNGAEPALTVSNSGSFDPSRPKPVFPPSYCADDASLAVSPVHAVVGLFPTAAPSAPVYIPSLTLRRERAQLLAEVRRGPHKDRPGLHPI